MALDIDLVKMRNFLDVLVNFWSNLCRIFVDFVPILSRNYFELYSYSRQLESLIHN